MSETQKTYVDPILFYNAVDIGEFFYLYVYI